MPAISSASLLNALSGVSASLGTSVRSVHASGGSATSAASTAPRPICLIDFDRKEFISSVSSELDLQPGRERPGAREGNVIDAAGGQTARHEHLGIVAVVVAEQEQ